MCVTIKPPERIRPMFTIGCHLSSAKGYLHMAKDGRVHRCQHVPVLHAQPARRPREGHRPEGRRGICRLCARARHRAHPGARALHAEPRLRQAADARFRAHGAGRGSGPYGGDAAPAVQHASRQRHRPDARGCHREDRRRAQPVAAAAPDHHAALGDDGGEGQRGRWHVRGAGGHHRAGGSGRPRGRVPGHVPRLGRRLRHRRRPRRRARRVRPRDRARSPACHPPQRLP